jgi:hypothetical protein
MLLTQTDTDSKKIVSELIRTTEINYLGSVQVIAKAVDS